MGRKHGTGSNLVPPSGGAAGRVSRRSLLAGGSAMALAASAGAAAAQGSKWWEDLPGFGGGNNRTREASVRPAAEPEKLNDLRPNSVPWRSDEMLQSIDAAIGHYERIAQRGGWQAVPTGRTVRPGDDDERVPFVRRRLAATGDMPAQGSSFRDNSYSYDDYVEDGVRRFQERNGLRVNGRVDRPTIDAMNITAQARIEQLKINKRRIQDLMLGRLEDRYVLVNAPAFQLEAVESYEVVQRHRVIVGKPDRQTPAIKATIKALNFFPYWRVPDSVAHLDLIPRLRKEPEYLRNEGIRVYNGVNGPELDPAAINWETADYRVLKFKQDYGERNALGLVRIDMPNPDIVYMHDTPLKPLFAQRQRAFSAGCVRVQDVFKLVEWIARQEMGWDQPGRVNDVIAANQPLDVNLTRPIPVYFAYITAWAERNGRVEFRPDIYGRDGIRDGSAQPDAEGPPLPSGGLAP